MTAPLETSQLVTAAAIVGVGATVQGSVGFGMALFSAPLLTLIDRRLVPGPVLVAGLVLTLLVAWRDRRSVDVAGVKWALIGRVPGTVAGAVALSLLPLHALTLVFGGIVVLAVLMLAFGVPLSPNVPSLLGAGLLSGFMGTTSSIGGPPVAMVYQHAKGSAVRGTLAGYFIFGASMSITALVIVGRFGLRELGWAMWLLPGVLLGFGISGRVTHWLDAGRTRTAVLIVSAVSGAIVVVKQLVV